MGNVQGPCMASINFPHSPPTIHIHPPGIGKKLQVITVLKLKGTVSRELRHRLLYIIRKFFFYTCDASHKIILFCKDFRTIYV